MEATARRLVPVSHTPTIDLAKIEEIMKRGVADGAYPGAVLFVGLNGELIATKAVGNRWAAGTVDGNPVAMSPDTVFDLGGLTSVVATTTLMMQLVQAGKLDLDSRVTLYLQGFGVLGKSPITVRQLLAHTSGLAPTAPIFEELVRENSGARLGILTSRGAREYVINGINRSALKTPAGTRQVFSDIGLIVAGHIVELLTGLSLEKAFHKYVAQPFGLKSTSFVDLALMKRRGLHPVREVIAPTEICSMRKKLLWGEAFDENAWAMGGIAGHSGLFSTAFDLHLFASEMVAARRNQSSIISREVLELFWEPSSAGAEPLFRLGWELPSSENGLAGIGFAEDAAGFNSSTGCSLWVEPSTGLDIVFLSNRVHPNRMNKKIQALRPELLKAIRQSLGTR